MTMAGDAHGKRPPSSEWRFHRDIYRSRPEIGAIVHTHAPYATTLACMNRAIPPFHYMVAIAGGRDIRCAPYATFGTQALSDHAVAALAGRRACLLAHHGMIAAGTTLEAALAWRSRSRRSPRCTGACCSMANRSSYPTPRWKSRWRNSGPTASRADPQFARRAVCRSRQGRLCGEKLPGSRPATGEFPNHHDETPDPPRKTRGREHPHHARGRRRVRQAR